jgi:hypothetical protein
VVIFWNYDMRLKSAQATRHEELSRIEVEQIQKEEVVLAVYNVGKDLRLLVVIQRRSLFLMWI